MATGVAEEHDLEVLLNRATDPSTETADELAVHLFCITVRNDSQLVKKATELLVSKIRSTNVTQSRKALDLLEECMSKCGSEFQTTIARFQFLNELIRLVSRKFSGDDTPVEIRNKILDSLSLWSVQYPDRTKIKEAYETLLRSGVQHEVQTVTPVASCKRSNLVDDENEKLLKKLLASKNREDHLRANLLIQYLVKQDAKKSELLARQRLELQEARTSATVLIEFVDRWQADHNTSDEELAKDIFAICKKSKSLVIKMPEIIEDNEQLLADAIEVNELLHEAIERYENYGKINANASTVNNEIDLMSGLVQSTSPAKKLPRNSLDEITDLFNQPAESLSRTQNQIDLLKPVFVTQQKPVGIKAKAVNNEAVEKNSKSLLPTIDQLSEDLFKQTFNAPIRQEKFKSEPKKIPIKDLILEKKVPDTCTEMSSSKEAIGSDKNVLSDLAALQLDSDDESKLQITGLDSFLSDMLKTENHNDREHEEEKIASSLYDDLLTCNESGSRSEDVPNIIEQTGQMTEDEDIVKIGDDINTLKKPEPTIKHLSEIELELNSIQPSCERPRIIMDDVQGLRVTLNLAKDRPSTHVIVIVISTINQSSSLVSDYQIDASVPKPCKLRLLTPTRNALPGTKPFRAPTEDIQQILLLFNPTGKPVDLTCIIGYRLGNDPDPIKESVIVDKIPHMV